jgi:hypothetical protein
VPDLKGDFYTAIPPGRDKVEKVWRSSRLCEADAAAVQKYPHLAIAVAVVWDDPRGIYDYRGHQVRTKSELPSGVMKMDAEECFKAHVARAKAVRGTEAGDRLDALPWEFLTLVVDHRTPPRSATGPSRTISVSGRWSQNLLRDRIRPGDAQDAVGGLQARRQAVHAESIKKHGGVCAMQADFAARVGKSCSCRRPTSPASRPATSCTPG